MPRTMPLHQIPFPPDLWKNVQRAAKNDGRSASSWIRQAVRDVIKGEVKALRGNGVQTDCKADTSGGCLVHKRHILACETRGLRLRIVALEAGGVQTRKERDKAVKALEHHRHDHSERRGRKA